MLLPAETSAASQITICGYERIKFELISIGSKRKQFFFQTFNPTVNPGARVGRPDHDRDRGHHVWRR
jgi:hypothetical protein